MYLGASVPARVFDKARECRFFLAHMGDYEGAGEIEDFLFCLSAFLSAFRSVAYRLYGVTKKQKGKAAKVALRKQLHDHPQIGFLIGRSNVEVHADGVKVWQRYNVSVGDSMSNRWPPSWANNDDLFEDQSEMRWPPRFQPHFHRSGQAQVVTVVDWQFEGHQSNLIALCHDALNEIEDFIRRTISVVP